MAIKWTELKLKAEWMGHPKGSILTLNSLVADDLFTRKVAVPAKNSKKLKSVASPPQDKMMRPVRQKRANA